jgi:iron complex transport system substrate-binding protein
VVSLAACNASLSPPRQPDGPPNRIVSLVPAVTEMLFEIGVGERVVGVTAFDAYPAAVRDLPNVGALLNPNFERILELQPDLVVIYGSQSALKARLATAEVPTFEFTTGSIDDMLESMTRLGEAVGASNPAGEATARIVDALEKIRRSAPDERPRVLIAHSRDPGVIGGFYTEGGPSYLTELVEIAGGVNLFADVRMTSFQPSLEEVIRRSPEVVIELLPSSAAGAASRRLTDWSVLESIPAVRNRRVYVLADDALLLVGPRIHEVAARLAEAIHAP